MNHFAGTKKSEKSTVFDVVLYAVLIALVLVATMFINIRLPISVNGGLIHLGNVPLLIAAIIFGKKKGAVAGAFGMGLFDLLSGWVIWAPFTFVIRGVMGYIIGMIAQKKKGDSILLNLIAVIAGGAWMIIGYYLTEVILYGNWYTPLTSVSGNVIQVALGAIIALPLIKGLKKVIKF